MLMFYLKRDIWNSRSTLLAEASKELLKKKKRQKKQASLAWTLEACCKTIWINANPYFNLSVLVLVKVWGIVLLLRLSSAF